MDYAPPVDLEGYIPPEEINGSGYIGEMPQHSEDAQNTEIKEYIMGKPSKAKEKLIKIKDITANDGRVTLEGRLVTSDVRETRSGKGMLIFELYDGSRNYDM